MLRLLHLLAILLLLPLFVCADEFIATEGFHLVLPDDWVEIPRQALDLSSKYIAKHEPALEKQAYDYGFQRRNAERWFVYPYILIRVKNTGRVPEAFLKPNKKYKNKMQEACIQLEKKTTLVSQTAIEDPWYDEGMHALWLTTSMDIKDVGPVKMLGAVILTERGAINIFGYSLKKEFHQDKELLQNIITSISLDKSLRYKPRITDSLPGKWSYVADRAIDGAIKGAAQGAILGLAGGLIYLAAAGILKRRKQKVVESRDHAD